MNKENRSIKSIELYKNGNVKRIEFYEPTQQPQFISSVFGSPQWIAKTDEVSSGSYTTTGSTGQLRQSADCMNVPISFDFFAELNTPEEDEAWKDFQREPCYICGKECEVMQSMMHAYTDIKVCGDCMIAHLYPFIESTKREKSDAFRQVQADDRIESSDDMPSSSIIESVIELIENRRLKVLNNADDPSWTEHFSELKNEIGELAKGLQPQHTLPGCRAWIGYDAVTTSLLIYFDGKPVESYVNRVNSRLATLHADDSHAIVGVMISNVGQKQA